MDDPQDDQAGTPPAADDNVGGTSDSGAAPEPAPEPETPDDGDSNGSGNGDSSGQEQETPPGDSGTPAAA